MKENEPGAGAVMRWAANSARVRWAICARVAPASTHFVRSTYMGSTVRTAGGLKQFGARTAGSQKTGSSTPAVQDRSMKQTKPLVPLTAVS